MCITYKSSIFLTVFFCSFTLNAAAEQRFMEQPHGPKATPHFGQVAPTVDEKRLPGEPVATTRHFQGEHTTPKSPTVLTHSFPEIDNELSTMDPFFRDTSVTLNVRSVYFRTQNNRTDSAWALGGSLLYESGWFKDFFHVGVGYYTSNGLYKPGNQTGAGTKLLKVHGDGSQHNINVLGQAYAEFKYETYRLKAYRQAIDTPFINEHFDRMIPQLFEAYLIGTQNMKPDEKGQGVKPDRDMPFNFMAGYVAEELDRGSTTFVPMSSIATGNRTSLDRGVAIGGIQVSPAENVSASLWEYYGVDMFNTLYAEADATFDLDNSGDWRGRIAFQFADQRNVGEAIVGNWSSQMAGIYTGVSYSGLTLSLRFNYNFDGIGTRPGGGARAFGMLSPWGRFPSFNKATVRDMNTPESAIYGIWLAYDFGALTSALDGLEFSTNYVMNQPGSRAQALLGFEREAEFDTTLKYSVPFVEGLSLEARGSWVSFDNFQGNYAPAINDYRLYFNYTIPLL